jgi:hypothetical protein
MIVLLHLFLWRPNCVIMRQLTFRPSSFILQLCKYVFEARHIVYPVLVHDGLKQNPQSTS